jgi:hypothetical protein
MPLTDLAEGAVSGVVLDAADFELGRMNHPQ